MFFLKFKSKKAKSDLGVISNHFFIFLQEVYISFKNQAF